MPLAKSDDVFLIIAIQTIQNAGILRWQIFGVYTILVIRGADNGLADFLSRVGVE